MLTLFSVLSVIILLLLSLLLVPKDLMSMGLFALFIGLEHFLGRVLIMRVVTGKVSSPVISDPVGATVHRQTFSMQMGNQWSRYCVSPLSLWSTGDVRATLQRFWLYVFRMTPLALPLSFLSLFIGSLLLILLIGNSGEIPPIVSSSIPVFAMVALLSVLFTPIKEAVKTTHSVYYLPCSEIILAKGLLLFLSVFMVPFVLLLSVPLFVGGADYLVSVNSLLAMFIVGLLFITVEVKSWHSKEVPLWYAPVIIFTLLTMTLSWGGTIVLTVMMGSLLGFLFRKKENQILSV